MGKEGIFQKRKTVCKPIVFIKNECWRQMKDLSDGSYFVSNLGRVMRFNSLGFFREIKPSLFCKSHYVSIEFDGEKRKIHTRKRLSKLVLKYFVGFSFKKKRIIHLNEDIKDCRLQNLTWKKGKEANSTPEIPKIKRFIPPIAFESKERWKQMEDLLSGNYFISTESRVMRLTPEGVFRELKHINQAEHAVVRLEKDSKISNYRVARLMLNYFVGPSYVGRRYIYKNGDKMDCRLKNLEWRSGFDNGIDYEYISKLKLDGLLLDDVKVVKYLKTKEVEILFEIVESHKLRLYNVLYKKQLPFDIKNNIATIVLEVLDSLEKGYYKPVSIPTRKNRVRKDRVCFFNFILNITMKLASEEKKYIHTPMGLPEDYFLNNIHLKTTNDYAVAL